MHPAARNTDEIDRSIMRNVSGGATMDGGLGFQSIVGELQAQTELLRIIAERIRVAAGHLKLSRDDLHRIFDRHSVFEAEVCTRAHGQCWRFIVVETHHLIQGKVGKGALKIVFPADMLGASPQFLPAQDGAVEVVPLNRNARWPCSEEPEQAVKQIMREFMTGESLSMSLKCQATGAPFAGSEGLILCAARDFDAVQGRYFLRPVLHGDESHIAEDRELINGMMNATSELLTRAGRIAYDAIVHAAETSTTLTARLGLQLPTNVVEGHLRCLLIDHPEIIIGDEDMTPRLKDLLARPDYSPTVCLLARTAATMQIEHSILLEVSREKLRSLLSSLPPRGCPSPLQYQQITNLFFGTGETQQNEDQLFQHRESILKPLSAALSVPCLDECGDPGVLALYLKTLLDNQRIVMRASLVGQFQPGQALPKDWMDAMDLLDRGAQEQLTQLMPQGGASRENVKESFWQIARILTRIRTNLARQPTDPYTTAKTEILERSIRAIVSVGGLVPSVDRILFFLLPYTYECVTPKLGVVTRKPIEVCGSALRPDAMAHGAVRTIEILLEALGHKNGSVDGMSVAIEGLGNAGKNAALLLSRKGAIIVSVSDSSGAWFKPAGFTPAELSSILAHKERGLRLASMHLADLQASSFDSNPESLKKMRADILVLAAISNSVCEANAADLQVKIVCELAGASVDGTAKRVLHQRQIHVIPDNLASSGGLLVSLSEMLQNSAGQNWDRNLEVNNLNEQLSTSFRQTLAVSTQFQVDLPAASDILALRRMHELAIYRERLEWFSKQLRDHIQSIRESEQIVILADNDEDGAASAAILHTLITQLNAPAAGSVIHLNESFRAASVLELVRRMETTDAPIRHLFAVDRAFPLNDPGRSNLVTLAGLCRVTIINNHDLPADLAQRQIQLSEIRSNPRTGIDASSVKLPVDLGILFISPQTLHATGPTKQFLTCLIMREMAYQLIRSEQVLAQIDWQAAVGSFLDLPPEKTGPWLLFFSRFNPDILLEVSRAARLMTRVGGFHSVVKALAGVTQPDQLHTNKSWVQFMAEYQTVQERLHVLVETIILENRRRPFTAHFFTQDELASPSLLAGDEKYNLDFYHWISEHIAQHGDLAQKPIITGQVVLGSHGRKFLGIRIRSPRGVDLMEVGLPGGFTSGGLPNTAIARIELNPDCTPDEQFQLLVEDIWPRTRQFSLPAED